MITLPRPLIQSFEMLAATAEALELRNDWIVFGGAAMALSGLPDWPVPDIDVLASEETANDLIDAFGGRIVTPTGQDRFRSRVDRPVLDRHIPTPRTSEQAQMARRFGRPKDLQRAEALDKLTD